MGDVIAGWAMGVERWWLPRKERCLRLVALGLLLLAIPWLSYQFWRLAAGNEPIWGTSPAGAIDLRIFGRMVSLWFAGVPVYAEMNTALYPPASFALLWPLVGWLPFYVLRWVWALLSAGLVYWISSTLAGLTGAVQSERRVLALLPAAIYATGATIGNGQLGLLTLAALLVSIVKLGGADQRWPQLLCAAAAMLFALVKPTLAAPFLWLALCTRRGWRVGACVVLGYLALTIGASRAQAQSAPALLRDWLTLSSQVATRAGSANLHAWLGALGLGAWIAPASLLALLVLGLWVWRHRAGDIWVLAAVCALVSRFWAHHAWYDDLILLLPLAALWRQASHEASVVRRVVAGLLVCAALAVSLAPGGLYILPEPLRSIYVTAQACIWLAVLAFLLTAVEARRRLLAPRPPKGRT